MCSRARMMECIDRTIMMDGAGGFAMNTILSQKLNRTHAGKDGPPRETGPKKRAERRVPKSSIGTA
jgi:hypothetical protein